MGCVICNYSSSNSAADTGDLMLGTRPPYCWILNKFAVFFNEIAQNKIRSAQIKIQVIKDVKAAIMWK